jgi:uncharacterized protein YukE
MSGLAMPGGDPGGLEQLASTLEAAARGFGELGRSTRQVSTSVRSDAEWSGDAADSYTAFTGNLSQGAAAVEAPLSRIALSVRDYAGYLRAAQQKVQTYATATEVAQVSGNDSGYVSVAEGAAQEAEAAVSAWQAAGNRVAAEVTSAAGQLGDVFGSHGPVQIWLGSQPLPLDTLAGMPGLGDPVMPQILKTPGMELGPEILTTPGAELGPEFLITLPSELGPEILKTPVAELGPGILKTPPGESWPLINYSKAEEEENEEIARTIAGHAQVHFAGSAEDAAETVQGVLDSRDSLVRNLGNDRTAYYNDGVIVIKNPKVPYGGTAYEGDLDDFLRLR